MLYYSIFYIINKPTMKITKETILENNNLIIDINIIDNTNTYVYYTITIVKDGIIKRDNINIISVNKETIRDSIIAIVNMLELTWYLSKEDTSSYNNILQETYDALWIRRDDMDNLDYKYKWSIDDIRIK